jgi:hypothetical protein
MPRIADSVVISDNFNALQPRFPYGLHDLVGANTMMLQLMRDNRVALGIQATVEDYNKTIASTFDMLQNQTLDLTLEVTETTLDTLFLELKLKNKAGHKFPSGYPSRRAFVELQVISIADGETLFHSGEIDNNNEVVGLDPNFEPHYEVINQEDQVQIYEIVPADVNANFTTVLERAAFSLKDNRLPPVGFKTNHAVYDPISTMKTGWKVPLLTASVIMYPGRILTGVLLKSLPGFTISRCHPDGWRKCLPSTRRKFKPLKTCTTRRINRRYW